MRAAVPGHRDGAGKGGLRPPGPLAFPERGRQPAHRPRLGRVLVLDRDMVERSEAVPIALREARALPSNVTGPRERAPVLREASIWAGLRGRGSGMAVVRRVAIGRPGTIA